MKEVEYKFEGLTMAIKNMPEMLRFYSNVFGIEFIPKQKYGGVLYSGIWGDLKLLFCPAEIARNEAQQNRHQFDIIVDDLNILRKLAEENGGKEMGGLLRTESTEQIGILDPDNNSILFKRYLN